MALVDYGVGRQRIGPTMAATSQRRQLPLVSAADVGEPERSRDLLREMIRIRKVDLENDEEVDELEWLHDNTFGSEAPKITDPIYGYWWLAVDTATSAPVGFAGLCAAAATPGTGYLKRCGVIPGARGQALQARFVRVREACARKAGWTRLITDTIDNIASANSLIKCGYRLFVPEVKWAFAHSLYWEKHL